MITEIRTGNKNKQDRMRLGRAATIAVCLAIAILPALGCQSPGHEPQRQWQAVPIESFGLIAGQWAGLMVSEPKLRHDDWVRATIAEDGTFDFASYRTIGVFSGRGQFALTEGTLHVTTERGTITGSLWISDGQRMLRMAGVMKNGTKYRAEIEPAK